ncbi:MAG: hypothetical protein WC002_02085 [Candidatus Muiribacteriota bacterium]
MYVDIGWEEYIRLKNIIGVFKKENSKITVDAPSKRVRYDKEVKSVILTKKGQIRIPIRSETIAKRVNFRNGGIDGK